MTQRHKWADVITAWANGQAVQVRYQRTTGEWQAWKTVVQPHPSWYTEDHYEYRVKPKDVVFERTVVAHAEQAYHVAGGEPLNVRYTFDADTRELTSVELIK